MDVMDVAVDLVTGIWVDVVATMWVVKVEFTGVVGVIVTGWASTLTLYLLLVRMVFFLLSFSWVLGPF